MVKKRAVFGKRTEKPGEKKPAEETAPDSIDAIFNTDDVTLPPGHLAAKRGDMEMYEQLKSEGYDFNTPGPRGVTAAHVMASWDRHEMLENAYNAGLIDVNLHDDNGALPKNLAGEDSLSRKFLTSVTSEMQKESNFVSGPPMAPETDSRFTAADDGAPQKPRPAAKSDLKS